MDVMNVIDAAALGVHVEESRTAWADAALGSNEAFLLNWNQQHWTVLQSWPPGDAPTHWRHTNSICSDMVHQGLRYDRRECSPEETAAILKGIVDSAGVL